MPLLGIGLALRIFNNSMDINLVYVPFWTAEMAMVNLTVISFSRVESQTFLSKTGGTWDIWHFGGLSAIEIFPLETMFIFEKSVVSWIKSN